MRISVFLEQGHQRGQHLVARQAGLAHVGRHALAEVGQQLAELHHSLVFGLFARFRPFGVVAVLLAPLGIAAGRLDVPVLLGADPDVGVGGRDADLLDPLLVPIILDRPALGVDEPPSRAGFLARDAGVLVRDVDETSRFRRLAVLVGALIHALRLADRTGHDLGRSLDVLLGRVLLGVSCLGCPACRRELLCSWPRNKVVFAIVPRHRVAW